MITRDSGPPPAFGAELRRLRQAAGLSLNALALRVHYSRGYLSKIENGIAKPNADLALLCDTELHAEGTLVKLLPKDTAEQETSAPPTFIGIPPVTPYFTGRQRELAEIQATLRVREETSATVCVIHGMAGVGKTTLALKCLHALQSEFADGVLFLNLRGHSPGSEVSVENALTRLLRLVGVPDEEIPADIDDRALLYQKQLHNRSILIGLDNARTAQQILPLIPGENRCRVVVTTRSRLTALDDAHHLEIKALSLSEGVELFDSLKRKISRESPSATLKDTVVEQCGRLPLAIRIAAARLAANPHWDLKDLARKLADQSAKLIELDDGERSIAAAFHLSYQYLTAQQRRFFALLALHPGSDWEISSAAALGATSIATTERLLADLYEANLISYQGAGRYYFHDLIRAYAKEIALPEISSSEQRNAAQRLLEVNLYTAELADKALEPYRYRRPMELSSLPDDLPSFDNSASAFSWLKQEWLNLVDLCGMAKEYRFDRLCWQLAFSLRSFFFRAKLWDPWLEIQLNAYEAAEFIDPWARAITANNLGLVRAERGEMTQAATHYREALLVFREINDGHGITTALSNLAWLAYHRGEYSTALAGMREVLAFYEQHDSLRNIEIALGGIALAQAGLGHYSEALSHSDRAFELLATLNLPLDTAMAHNVRGWVHYLAGNHEEAVAAYEKALELSEKCESPFEAARAETGLGNVAAVAGNSELAKAHWLSAAERHSRLKPATEGEVRHQKLLSRALSAPATPSQSASKSAESLPEIGRMR